MKKQGKSILCENVVQINYQFDHYKQCEHIIYIAIGLLSNWPLQMQFWSEPVLTRAYWYFLNDLLWPIAVSACWLIVLTGLIFSQNGDAPELHLKMACVDTVVIDWEYSLP